MNARIFALGRLAAGPGAASVSSISSYIAADKPVDGQCLMDDISMVVTCDYITIKAYHRRRPELSVAPLNRKYNNNDKRSIILTCICEAIQSALDGSYGTACTHGACSTHRIESAVSNEHHCIHTVDWNLDDIELT